MASAEMEESRVQVLERSFRELSSIIHRHEKTVRNLETKLMKLAVFYILVQVILYSAISQTSYNTTKCNKWWIPFSLSPLVAVIFNTSFIVTIITWVRTTYQYDLNLMDRETIHQRMNMAKNHTISGVSSCCEVKGREPEVYGRYAYACGTVAAFLAFTALILHGCTSISCGHSP